MRISGNGGKVEKEKKENKRERKREGRVEDTRTERNLVTVKRYGDSAVKIRCGVIMGPGLLPFSNSPSMLDRRTSNVIIHNEC